MRDSTSVLAEGLELKEQVGVGVCLHSYCVYYSLYYSLYYCLHLQQDTYIVVCEDAK